MRLPKLSLPRRHWLGLVACCCTVCVVRAQTARRVIEEPEPVKIQVRDVSAGVYSEGSYEETSFGNSVGTVSHERIFVGPLFGVSAVGSVYHPNFMRYHLDTEGAYGFSHETIKAGSFTTVRETWQWLGRANGSASFFSTKPFHCDIFGGYDHSYRDYDFFNRVTVDSWRYGNRSAYSVDNLFLSAGYTHRDEEVSGLRANTTSHDDNVTFTARHDRKSAGTTFNYTFDQYSRVDLGRAGDGSDHTVSIGDYERFGDREQYVLNSTGSYTHRDANEETSDQFTAASNLSAEHRHNLSSFYDVNYDHYESGAFASDGVSGNAELRHQLYQSLTSSLLFRGGDFEGSDNVSSGYSRRYGGGITETYTKRIGSRSRLRVSNSLLVDHFDQQTVSTVENERHRFDEGFGPPGTFFLNGSRIVETTIVITDANDSMPAYVRGIDYDIQINGDRTLITRPAGSRIGVTAVVLVDYRSEPGAAGGYEALTEMFQVRYDIIESLWGVYGRFNLWRNNATRDLRVPNLTSYAVGSDLTWRFLRAGVEYEMYDSDLSTYNSTRLYQTFTFALDAVSSLDFTFSEAFIDYVDAHRSEEDYRFITHYRHALSSKMRFDIEGGVDLRRGDTIDQTLATVRPGIECNIGKTTIKAGYDFEYNLFDEEERLKHLFFVRARRVF